MQSRITAKKPPPPLPSPHPFLLLSSSSLFGRLDSPLLFIVNTNQTNQAPTQTGKQLLLLSLSSRLSSVTFDFKLRPSSFQLRLQACLSTTALSASPSLQHKQQQQQWDASAFPFTSARPVRSWVTPAGSSTVSSMASSPTGFSLTSRPATRLLPPLPQPGSTARSAAFKTARARSFRRPSLASSSLGPSSSTWSRLCSTRFAAVKP